MQLNDLKRMKITELSKMANDIAIEGAQGLKKQDLHLRDLFAEDPGRGERLTLEAAGLYLDYAKNRITDETVALLVRLAEESDLRSRIDAMFAGERINITEDRPALHVALRAPRDARIVVGGRDVVPDVHEVLDRMAAFTDLVRSGAWTGHTGRRIRNVVNIGIGGSDLGPVMAYEALRHSSDRALTFRFVSNVDGTDLVEATRDLDPAETLFIVSSKTFTTLETMTNARSARAWLVEGTGGQEAAVAKHFVAVSTNADGVGSFGIETQNMFGFWDWVGGRYSMDSAIGLSTMLAIGPAHFREMLDGFHAMDEHFRTAPFDANMPVLMGLLSVWYGDFFGAQTMAVLPYEQYLKRFPAYLQQLTMESNGKHVTLGGAPVEVQTGPIVWGEPGTNGQHSFYQLIHQGTALIRAISSASRGPGTRSVTIMICCSRTSSPKPKRWRSGRHRRRSPPRARPHGSCRTACSKATARRTRSWRTRSRRVSSEILVALYEHSVFTQAAIWGIDPFDQWGVELGKTLAQAIIPELQSTEEPNLAHDSSTNALIRRYRRTRTPPS